MSRSSLHVLIVGGGLSGLCLAQGLRQAGISVAIYERDVSLTARPQGYRLHIDSRGVTGLRTCLPPHLFELFLATTSPPSRRVTVFNKHLRVRKTIGTPATMNTTDPTRLSAAVDRLTLREILFTDLDKCVHFAKEFTHYEQLADGSVQAFFADGTETQGDVLVAADGVNSRIRRQFLPEVAVVDTGIRCIYGKTRLTAATQPLIPALLHHGFAVATSLRFGLALGLVEFRRPPAEAAAQLAPGVQFHTNSDYLMWSLNAKRARLASSDQDLFGMDGLALQQLVLKKMKSWHPDLQTLVAAAEIQEIFPIAVRTAVPCQPWRSTTITFLGDAIHAMSPAGGSGANMALLDAHLLCQTLISVAHEEKSLLPALHEYEGQMLKAGFEAVNFSARGGVFR